jgi:hypothetical protein
MHGMELKGCVCTEKVCSTEAGQQNTVILSNAAHTHLKGLCFLRGFYSLPVCPSAKSNVCEDECRTLVELC